MSNSPDRNKVLQQIRDRIERSVRKPRPSLSSEEVAAHLDAVFAGTGLPCDGNDLEQQQLDEAFSRYVELKFDPAKGISAADSRARFERRHAAEMARANKE